MRIYKKESGQTSIIIFFLLVVGLSIGIGVSSDYIKTLRISKETDLSLRAVAIAEAAVERMLAEEYSILEEYINNNSCGSACVLEITDPKGVVSRADVTLSHLGSTEEPFPIELTTTETRQAELSGYPDGADVYVCWDSILAEPSVVAMNVYGTGASYAIDNYAYNSAISSYTYNGFDSANPLLGYGNCFTVSGRTNPVFLRLKAVYSDVTVYIIPASGQALPSQGILIESVGSVFDTVKTVRVLRTRSAVPSQFDYAIYQKSETDPLSN